MEKLGGFPQACWLFCSPQDDLGLDDLNGWEVGKRIKNYCLRKGLRKTPFLLYTGWDKKFEPENWPKAVQTGWWPNPSRAPVYCDCCMRSWLPKGGFLFPVFCLRLIKNISLVGSYHTLPIKTSKLGGI